MKCLQLCLTAVVGAALSMTGPLRGDHLGTKFTYQGRLERTGSPVAGELCDFRFGLWDAAVGGAQQGASPQTILDVSVDGGLFTAMMDFGPNSFQSHARWLEIEVQCLGDAQFVRLLPRVELTAAPQALDLRLPYSAYVTTGPGENLFSVTNSGAGGAAYFETYGGGGAFSAMLAAAHGAGPAIYGYNDGSGRAARFDATSATSTADALFADTAGLGRAGMFAINNAGNSAAALYATTTGTGPAIQGDGMIHSLRDGFKFPDATTQSSAGWSMKGNAGTTPGTSFLGTTDNQAFEVHVNGQRALRIEPDATAPNIIGGYSGNTATDAVIGATIAGGGQWDEGEPRCQGGGNDGLPCKRCFGGPMEGYLCFQDLECPDGVCFPDPTACEPDGVCSSLTLGNRVTGAYGSIGGGADNQAGAAEFATVGGGRSNAATGLGSMVGGGSYNTASAGMSTVGGGDGSSATGWGATVGGGGAHYAAGANSAIGGGWNNHTNEDGSTVGGGYWNFANKLFSTVGGGSDNGAYGTASTVPGGSSNSAGGDYSFAAGYGAVVRNAIPESPYYSGDADGDEGTFVWADSTSGYPNWFPSTGPNQFLIKASGGMGINTNAPMAALHIGGTPGVDGLMFPDGTLQTSAATGGGDSWSLTGNSGTTPGTHFLGTTDDQALEIHVNGQRALRVEPNGEAPNLIAGYSGNTILPGSVGATIAGGGDPTLGSNQISGRYSCVGGGFGNAALNDQCTIAGGMDNLTNGYNCTIGGGVGNISGRACLGGTQDAAPCFDSEDCPGGACIWGGYATIGGGDLNAASGGAATIAGGESNHAVGNCSTIAGGCNNHATGLIAPAVGGGVGNTASEVYSTVAGGYGNSASGSESTIGGGTNNTAMGQYATVSGGILNTAAYSATVGGGMENAADGDGSTIAGGTHHTASGDESTIGGGTANTAGGYISTICGGMSGHASGNWATIGGGDTNVASGEFSTVPGGRENQAGGYFSFAAGRQAKVRDAATVGNAYGDEGTFVWADSQSVDFISTGHDQFLVRAVGGMYLGTDSTVSIPAGRFINTSTGAYLTSGGTWTNSSDRNVKENIRSVDPADILARVTKLDISRWNYKAESHDAEHLGPMGQDFFSLFGLGDSDKSIATIDADGVALAAIQGLHQIVQDKDSEIAKLQVRLAALEKLVAELAADRKAGGK